MHICLQQKAGSGWADPDQSAGIFSRCTKAEAGPLAGCPEYPWAGTWYREPVKTGNQVVFLADMNEERDGVI
jgi:hypothetical protein